MALVIGMNSGSSFDGIDVVLIETDLALDGHPLRPHFIAGLAHAWPVEVAAQVLRAFANELTIFELCRLNYTVGAVYAEAARQLLADRALDPAKVTAIGVDGQTIYQEPPDRSGMRDLPPEASLVTRWLDGPYPCGLQIGEPSLIAAHTEITTVSQFRPADHAIGGTGAPLMQYLDFVAFRETGPVLTLNIGGIANCQFAHPDRARMRAFDTGPGNVMLDHAARRLFSLPHDPDGRLAAAGAVDEGMLAHLLSHPFFARRPPRSAWRLDFGAEYADSVLDTYAGMRPEDIMATLCAFTATSIVRAVEEHIPDIVDLDVLVASGGGVRNAHLMRLLRESVPAHLRLTTSDEYGIPAQFEEAIKFATLAFATINNVANNIPACSGASRYTILGKIAPAPRLARGIPG
ncbi:MAG: putative anhydro-n-acetylmuramic acid kinase protein [Chloroflexi bacterium]|nr:putative anhydro-n-acetylmuramic acid kinase protein [Chloroflexota bacterium]